MIGTISVGLDNLARSCNVLTSILPWNTEDLTQTFVSLAADATLIINAIFDIDTCRHLKGNEPISYMRCTCLLNENSLLLCSASRLMSISSSMKVVSRYVPQYAEELIPVQHSIEILVQAVADKYLT